MGCLSRAVIGGSFKGLCKNNIMGMKLLFLRLKSVGFVAKMSYDRVFSVRWSRRLGRCLACCKLRSRQVAALPVAGGELKGCRRGMKFFGEMGRKYLEISEICCNFASLLGIKCARAGVNPLRIRCVVRSYGVNENINN